MPNKSMSKHKYEHLRETVRIVCGTVLVYNSVLDLIDGTAFASVVHFCSFTGFLGLGLTLILYRWLFKQE